MNRLIIIAVLATVCTHAMAHDITAEPDSIPAIHQLGEVTVKANNIIVSPDKITVLVGGNVKRHSYDGYSALSLMNIPGLSVDVLSGSVSADGQSVMMCINGIEATQDEIKTLNPNDIKKIDYYTNFDPEHPTARYVINFVMKIRDYGGSVMLQADQALNSLIGNGIADWKTFRKKSEFGIRITPSYDHLGDTKSYSERTFDFEAGNIIKRQTGLPSEQNVNGISNKFTYVHRFTHSTLKAAVSLSARHSRKQDATTETYSGLLNTDDESFTDAHSDQLNTSVAITYSHKLKNKGSLVLGLNGGYSHIDATRDYYSMRDFLSTTKENYRSINPAVSLSMPLGKVFTPYISAFYLYDKSNMRYRENGDATPSELTFQQGCVEAGTNMRLSNRLSATARIQGRFTSEDPGSESHSGSYFTPGFTISYSLPKTNRINTAFFWGVYNPTMSYYTHDEKQIDNFMTRVGNPDLRLEKIFEGQLSFISAHSWGHFQLYSTYGNLSHAIYRSYSCDEDRSVYVQSFLNGGSYETLRINPNATVNIFDGHIKAFAATQFRRQKARTYRLMDNNAFMGLCGFNFAHNGWSGEVELRTAHKELSQLGEIISRPVSLKVTAGYVINGWSFNLLCRNPFIRSSENVSFSYPGVRQFSRTFNSRRSYNYFSLRISYRFSYGKKHKYEDVQINEGGGSAILEH